MKSVKHPLYGEIPMIEVPYVTPKGRPTSTWTWDLAYRPPLPKGALRGDPRRQSFCCDVPKYFYLDIDATCIECGRPFVFEAR